MAKTINTGANNDAKSIVSDFCTIATEFREYAEYHRNRRPYDQGHAIYKIQLHQRAGELIVRAVGLGLLNEPYVALVKWHGEADDSTTPHPTKGNVKGQATYARCEANLFQDVGQLLGRSLPSRKTHVIAFIQEKDSASKESLRSGMYESDAKADALICDGLANLIESGTILAGKPLGFDGNDLINIQEAATAMILDAKTVREALKKIGVTPVPSPTRQNAHAAKASDIIRAFSSKPNGTKATEKLTAFLKNRGANRG